MIQTAVSFLFDFNTFFLWVHYLSFFVIATVFTWNNKILLKDFIFIILAALFCGLFANIQIHILPYGSHEQPIFAILATLSYFIVPGIPLLIYFSVLKSYEAKDAVLLTIFSYFILIAAMFSATFIFTVFFNASMYHDLRHSLISMLGVLVQLIFSAFFAFLAVRLTVNIREKANSSPTMKTALMTGILISWITFELMGTTIFIIEGSTNFWVMIILVFGYVSTAIINFYFYTKSLNAQLIIRQKEVEQKNLQFYMSEIEQQQTAIRKFKHDQQNLFSAMDIFIQEKDFEGMSQFYTKVREASAVITKDEFQLEGLVKIKVREVKNILIAKILMAQNLGLDTKLEVADEIDYVSIDSVSLVRMLGIILDNAIEELQHLGTGQLFIACFNVDNSVNFVVRNSRRSDILPIRQLRQPGFSTKGTGRGFGLSNLYELTDSLPNTALLTDTNDGNFTQTLIIGGTL